MQVHKDKERVFWTKLPSMARKKTKDIFFSFLSSFLFLGHRQRMSFVFVIICSYLSSFVPILIGSHLTQLLNWTLLNFQQNTCNRCRRTIHKTILNERRNEVPGPNKENKAGDLELYLLAISNNRMRRIRQWTFLWLKQKVNRDSLSAKAQNLYFSTDDGFD